MKFVSEKKVSWRQCRSSHSSSAGRVMTGGEWFTHSIHIHPYCSWRNVSFNLSPFVNWTFLSKYEAVCMWDRVWRNGTWYFACRSERQIVFQMCRLANSTFPTAVTVAQTSILFILWLRESNMSVSVWMSINLVQYKKRSWTYITTSVQYGVGCLPVGTFYSRHHPHYCKYKRSAKLKIWFCEWPVIKRLTLCFPWWIISAACTFTVTGMPQL